MPAIGQKVSYRHGMFVYTGYVNAIIDSERVIVGLREVYISSILWGTL